MTSSMTSEAIPRAMRVLHKRAMRILHKRAMRILRMGKRDMLILSMQS